MRRVLFGVEHEAFRESVRAFLGKEVVPHLDAWDAAGIVPRELFTTAGAAGFLGMAIPEELGGGGCRASPPGS
jgi:alkylation response protein AidB-like acyl-CoA dehydrogenase